MPTSVREYLRRGWVVVAAALLAACSASTPIQRAVPSALQGASAGSSATRFGAKKSWMDPAAVSKKLLYVSDIYNAKVYVFTYPYLTLAGVLTGFSAPAGMCTDPTGNVWIVDGGINGSGGAIYEYAHGGTSPVNVIPQPASYPLACSVNPQTGDLAVTAYTNSVYVYGNAFGSPTAYPDTNFCSLTYDGYDKAGDLFVDGFDCSNNFHFAELPAGSSSFTDITLNTTPASPGDLQWDGTFMDVGDTSSTLYQTQGSSVVGTVTLGTTGLREYYILPSHKKAIAADWNRSYVGIYAYPGGGAALKVVAGGLVRPVGTVLSQ